MHVALELTHVPLRAFRGVGRVGVGSLSRTPSRREGMAIPRFSSYDFGVVNEQQIQEWADEAEAGYDVDELKRRGRGRPGRGAAPMQVVAVRLTADELDALDAAAAKNHMSRSEAIRAALAQLSA